MNLNASLTRRESEICEWIAAGYCKKEIADKLFISVYTVENTARNIYRKAEVTKAVELCRFWFVRTFCIPVEALPKSMAALAFLMLFGAYEYKASENITRVRTRRSKDEYECIADVIDFKAPEYLSL